MVLHIFLQAIVQSLSANCCPGAVEDVEKAALRIGAMAFIHRIGLWRRFSPTGSLAYQLRRSSLSVD